MGHLTPFCDIIDDRLKMLATQHGIIIVGGSHLRQSAQGVINVATTAAMLAQSPLITWSLEYREGIGFSGGIGSPDDPTISTKDLDGTMLLWVEIGAPSLERLHRAAKASKRVSVYCHRSADQVYQRLTRESIFSGENISFYSFEEGFIQRLCAALARRDELSLSLALAEQVLYVTLNDADLTSTLQERRLR